MGVTINVNGLSLVHRGSGGISIATLPNVCRTAAGDPQPFGNVAVSVDLAGGSASVKVDGGFSAAVAGSVFARSVGDEPGVGGGVLSGTHGAEATFLTSSPNVRIEGRAAARLTDKMLHNRGNTMNASGLGQEQVAQSASTANTKTVSQVRFEVIDHNGHPVHSPVTVVLKATGIKRSSKRRNKAHQVVFHDVPIREYRAVAIHGCYPEAAVKVKVTPGMPPVKIQLARAKLRDVANGRQIDVGVQAPNPQHIPGIAAEFNYVVQGTIWNSFEGNSPADVIGDWITFKVRTAPEPLYAEVTPLFWAASISEPPLKPAKPGKKQRKRKIGMNPYWINSLFKKKMTPGERRVVAVKAVKNYITKVVQRITADGVLARVHNWVVINEPMNVLTRTAVREARFFKALMPVVLDKTYAPKEIAALKRHNKRIAAANKKRSKKQQKPLKPVPLPYKLSKSAVQSMVEIYEHAQSLLPPTAKLIIGDYGIEGYDGKKGLLGMRGKRFYDLLVAMIKHFKANGNANAITQMRAGFQAHLRSGGQLESASTQEPLDFRPSAIRSQVKRLAQLGVKIAVTEADLELPVVKDGKKQVKLVQQHMAAAKKKNYKAPTYFKNEKRRALYLKAFATQRNLMRDSVAAMLWAGNVESFTWWGYEDGLPAVNFRYHGYLFHRHLVCKHCKDDPDMQVTDALGVAYRKPKYWASVAAFASPANAQIT